MTLPRILREPLLHFLALGAALFLAFEMRGGSSSGPKRIVLTAGRLENLSAGFARIWQRPPTDAELKGLIDDYVREELAVREAQAMGLDRDDTIIRRRLRQKLEFLAEETLEASPPTEAALEEWLRSHPESFRSDPEAAFRQVYISLDRRGSTARTDAVALLRRLRAAGPEAAIEQLGDPLMLPHEVPLASRNEISRLFGQAFTDTLFTVTPGAWTGPIESGYGLHLVLVLETQEARLPSLDEVRSMVEREVDADRKTRQLEALYARLLEGYTITLEAAGDDSRTGPDSTRRATRNTP